MRGRARTSTACRIGCGGLHVLVPSPAVAGLDTDEGEHRVDDTRIQIRGGQAPPADRAGGAPPARDNHRAGGVVLHAADGQPRQGAVGRDPGGRAGGSGRRRRRLRTRDPPVQVPRHASQRSPCHHGPLVPAAVRLGLLRDGRHRPASFSQPLTRSDSLYFTVTVFSTVGFGDILATSQTAKLAVTVQMVLNLLFLGLGVRVIVGAVELSRQRRPPASPDQRRRRRTISTDNGTRTRS